MKKSLLGSFALIVLAAGTASAADMPIKAPLYEAPPVAVYNWTGCYIGANGGYAWQSGGSSYRYDPNNNQDPINGIPSTVFIAATGLQTIPTPASTDGKGLTGGGQVGCNWQMDRRVVLGIEGDIDTLRVSGSVATVGPNAAGFLFGFYQVGPSALVTGGGTANEQVSLRWLSTIRARAGLPVLADRALIFVTGGLAVGGASSSGMVDVHTNFTPSDIVWGGSNSSVRTGYAVGGGFEYALTDHWTTKAEYLYYNLGNVSHPLNLLTNTTSTPVSDIYPTLGTTASAVHGSLIRLGLNYRFDWLGGPITTRY